MLTFPCDIDDITGLNNIQMSYASFTKTISLPYKVNITDWPPGVPQVYPQKLNAEETRELYAAWHTSATHWYHMTNAEAKVFVKQVEEDGDLDPRPRKKCKSTWCNGSGNGVQSIGDDDDGKCG